MEDDGAGADLRRVERRYRALFDRVPLGINLCNLDGVIVESNRALQEMLGYAPGELDGMNFRDFTHPDDLATDDELFRELVAGKRDYYRIDKREARADGEMIWVGLTVALVRGEDGEPEETIAIVEDITARKQLEREQEAMLEREREQVERLRELDHAKDVFVAAVSHELRTPLTSVLGSLQTLLRPDLSLPPGGYERLLRVALEEGKRLTVLVDDLLMLTRAEMLPLEMRRLQLRPLAERAVQSLVVPAGRRIEVELADAAVVGDETRLLQVLSNLLVNAIRHGSGTITVRGGVLDSQYRLEISDEGPGIPVDERAHLFERFYRGRLATSEGVQGTGLGLSIAKAIVEGHGGAIGVDGAVGEGTRFWIELPLAA